ncbi:hypothetical protein, partial [Sphingobium sp. D43FB]
EAIFMPLLISFLSLTALKTLFDALHLNNIITMLLSLGVTYLLIALRLFIFRFDTRRLQWRNTLI